jgi:hypothetical protein
MKDELRKQVERLERLYINDRFTDKTSRCPDPIRKEVRNEKEIVVDEIDSMKKYYCDEKKLNEMKMANRYRDA